MYIMKTFTEEHIRRNPIMNNIQSIIIETLFPYFPTSGPTKNIGKYWPIIPKDAVQIKKWLNYTFIVIDLLLN